MLTNANETIKRVNETQIETINTITEITQFNKVDECDTDKMYEIIMREYPEDFEDAEEVEYLEYDDSAVGMLYYVFDKFNEKMKELRVEEYCDDKLWGDIWCSYAHWYPETYEYAKEFARKLILYVMSCNIVSFA